MESALERIARINEKLTSVEQFLMWEHELNRSQDEYYDYFLEEVTR